MDSVNRIFVDLLRKEGLDLTEEQQQQFADYYEELIVWNERMNLTAIKEMKQVYIKHFYDSLSVSFFFPMDSVQSIVDIGSGAGFPSLPLKIMFPHLQVTIVDSLNKRIQFLNHVTNKLHLTHVNCIHGRAEDLARLNEHRDAYDLVTARAVARLNVLNEFCLPFAKVGGTFIAMKGSDPTDEISEAKYSMKQLQSKLENVVSFQLPIEDSDRNIIMIKKVKRTPAKYPRKAGIPLKNPLV